ncbi:MAG: NAD-dependent deacylase [Deltaproteobacteria bacterium]|jgi:NAD-dependent deacetylase|nr:NAD-dependent deacylase [Deltaproteobacteria bacterium]
MLVILTGAGISKESGLDTFRDAGGLWQKVSMEDVATPEGFARDPDGVHAFHNSLRKTLLSESIAPNAAHLALGRLEKESAEPVLLITQNIDNLHERGGSKAVLHMHGELLQARCTRCRKVFPWLSDLFTADPCPECSATGTLRPNIVWFGEVPFFMDEISQALSRCSTFVSIGTSGNVYPAANFCVLARQGGARLVELNLEPSNLARVFNESHYGPATRIVPEWVESVLKSGAPGKDGI